VIDVISTDGEKLDHADTEMLRRMKMSSTFIREWIVERSKEEEEEEEEEAQVQTAS
jgi:pantetheine-phosphate adenylyltransferase